MRGRDLKALLRRARFVVSRPLAPDELFGVRCPCGGMRAYTLFSESHKGSVSIHVSTCWACDIKVMHKASRHYVGFGTATVAVWRIEREDVVRVGDAGK